MLQHLRRLPLPFLCLTLCCVNLRAQLVVKLKPATLTEFEAYVTTVEAAIDARNSGKENFLEVEDSEADLTRCLQGKLLIKQMTNGEPVSITDGLIHDWKGAVYMPGTTIEKVLGILEDFDNHQNIYPAVTESRIIQRHGHDVVGYWHLQQKGFVPVILDVEQNVRYQQISPGKWRGRAYAKKIVETDTTPFARSRKFPPDEGHGYLWRLYSYWSLEARDGGVLAECRTLSLSRDIPQGLAWAVGPYVQKMPESSLTSTLEQTRQAAAK